VAVGHVITTQPAVFLDRDGVLNAAVIIEGRPHPPRSLAEVVLLPGVEQACSRLRAEGFRLVCVTNQPDIARGTVTAAEVDVINEHISARLALDAVAVCPHDDRNLCECRKPKPGLIVDAAAALGLDIERSVVVGDRWRDVEAARRVGCAAVFIDHDYHEPRPEGADAVAGSLFDAVPSIISLARRGAGSPTE
jgi:D-glycero-D-manno-heptose 1,7-bisphosphate phosphatase